MFVRSALFFVTLLAVGMAPAPAATIGPPMFDIAHQCDQTSHHNQTAMSECVVAESEARAALLQNWAKYSDDSAERCIKAGRKARRLPYSAMEKCLSAETAATGPAASPGPPKR